MAGMSPAGWPSHACRTSGGKKGGSALTSPHCVTSLSIRVFTSGGSTPAAVSVASASSVTTMGP
jgi:hypothetical protein